MIEYVIVYKNAKDQLCSMSIRPYRGEDNESLEFRASRIAANLKNMGRRIEYQFSHTIDPSIPPELGCR